MVAERLAGLIGRHGEAMTVAGVAVTALVSLATPNQTSPFMESDGAYLVNRPIYHGLVVSSVAAAVSDAVVWQGVSYVVHHVHPMRWRGAVVAKIVIWS